SDTDDTGMTDGPADAEEGITSSFAAVDEQLADETSILNYYKRAIALRDANPEIARGTIEKVEELCDGNTAAILKTWEESTIAILYNTSDEETEMNLTGTALSGMEISGYLTLNDEEIVLADDAAVLPAQSILVLR
ncbi:MAG: alpha amylase, partial [Lachnospiraceae bacterium]|nr:alpha amylase [Lachnospiraceae bacterium]